MWKYREWIIDALNRDLSFDRFVVEQLAGDLLPGATRRPDDCHRLPLHGDVRRHRSRMSTSGSRWPSIGST